MADPGCQKDQKVHKAVRFRARVIGRADGGLNDRMTIVQGEQPAASAYDRTIGQAHSISGAFVYFLPKRQMSANARKFNFHFGKIQLIIVATINTIFFWMTRFVR
jgi:hypothetical protein